MRHPRYGLGSVLLLSLLSFASTAPAAEQAAPPSDVSRQGGSLSTKLNATSGVIHPEGGVDPGMQKTAPSTGKMPIVPPPGTAGGQPDVIPK